MLPSPRLSLAAFARLDLALVVGVLAVMAGVLVPRIEDRRGAERDARRLADMRVAREAIERFRAEHGRYPRVEGSAEHGGWDVSHDGVFLGELLEAGHLAQPLHDPIDDDAFHYRYYLYPEESYGCCSPGGFYVLGIKRLESATAAEPSGPGFACPGRDFDQLFAWTTGGGAPCD